MGCAPAAGVNLHIPKLCTLKGLRSQARGIRAMAGALVKNARGTTPLTREKGRVRAMGGAVAYWIEGWYVLERRGWVRTHADP